MIDLLSSSYFLISVLLLLCFFILQLIIIPLLRIYSYSQKGIGKYFFPILGFWRYFQTRGKLSLKELSKQYSQDKVLVTHVGKTMIFLLKDPAYKKEFFHKQPFYHKAEIILQLKELMGNGLVFAEDETWKRHRKIVSASFHFNFIKERISYIQKVVREILDKVSPSEYKDYSVIHRIEQITGEVAGRIFFGESLNEYTFEGKPLTLALADIMVELQAVGMTPLFALFGLKALRSPFIPRCRRIMDRVRGFRTECFKIVAARKMQLIEYQKSCDLLTLLLKTQVGDEKSLTDEDIVDEFITFFMAGMDTTGHLIGMTLYNLEKYPEYLKEVREEIEKTYKKEKEVTAETFQKMDVLHSFLKEKLRVYTPVPAILIKVVVENLKILDLELKKGNYVSADLAASGFYENYFENPEVFNPGRWNDQEKKLDTYVFTPFGAGPRNCIGQHLAIFEAKIIIAEFVSKFMFHQKEG